MLHYHELVFLKVEGVFYTNETLEKLMFDELKQSCRTQGYGGFLPGMKQIGNVAALPGIVGVSQVFCLMNFAFNAKLYILVSIFVVLLMFGSTVSVEISIHIQVYIIII